jgi:hypothetical protein
MMRKTEVVGTTDQIHPCLKRSEATCRNEYIAVLTVLEDRYKVLEVGKSKKNTAKQVTIYADATYAIEWVL